MCVVGDQECADQASDENTRDGDETPADLAPEPSARGLSAEIPVIVMVRTLVVMSGTARARAVAFWMPMLMPRTTMNTAIARRP